MNTFDVTNSVKLNTISETDTVGEFEIEGLYRGFSLTIGNALRRVLLSSLPGAAITRVKIKGVGHEFSTISGVLEDVVEITLNLKKVRFRMHTDEPQVLTLKVKGEREVTSNDIKGNAQIDVISKDSKIATITDKGVELEMELTVEKGLGYEAVDSRKAEKLPVGIIDIDAVFSPVINVNFITESMRVGDQTDYNRSKIIIETDGSISPSMALKSASTILQELFEIVSGVEGVEHAEKEKKKKTTKKTASEKKEGKKEGKEGEEEPAEEESKES
ncbi:MAG: DNA-directed RNA polymerase subunit alpha [Candidatus Harrisonbacteria bacterium CG10_big_fil_rev_8_21_14_0_10_42_17]|uniref:DNA-directed RNA polymerase subunit alpha n=1 Tax=Candidatus Harrisonbacteria bacterium CG10_big_fil_rev_8_21_14_0_10_42_17 TaxID=1974584 RepID=A0A2M6WHX4_9BACT|nr:MAG: DNA-directed RNA polymerase subunit alpha [Candidatus Harrisonbacteria bacterium CG10_big_fil_rev_8_21_14_0_10_42_17]